MKNNKNFTKSGFTLVELIVSLFIGTFVLVYTFGFVGDSIVEISKSNRQSKILSSFYEFSTKLNNYRNVFFLSEVLVDNSSGSGSDVLLLKDSSSEFGVIFGVVDKDNKKLETNSNYDLYYYKVLGYRELSNQELSDIETTTTNIYNYEFHNDKIFDSFPVKDFQVSTYNSGTIIDLDVSIVTNYKKGLSSESWQNLLGEELLKINLNF